MYNKYTNHYSPEKDVFYYKFPMTAYYIYGSHNTEMIKNQIFSSADTCFFDVLLKQLYGGQIEIDLYKPTKDKNDIIVTHWFGNVKKTRLSKILNIINSYMKYKIKNNIMSGPLIIYFDNKAIKKDSDIALFWLIVLKHLDKKHIMLSNSFQNYNIEELNNKVIFMVNNTFCNDMLEISNNKNIIALKEYTISTPAELNRISYPNNNTIVTIKKQKVTLDINIVFNSWKYLLRSFSSYFNIFSQNVNPLFHYFNGYNIVSLNEQTLDKGWIINKAIFNTNNRIHAYRLKPLWLLGLQEYPYLYDLTIHILSPVNNIIIVNPLTNETSSFTSKITIKDVNPTLPVYILGVFNEDNWYLDAIFVPWDFNNLVMNTTCCINKYENYNSYIPCSKALNTAASSYNIDIKIEWIKTNNVPFPEWYKYNECVKKLKKENITNLYKYHQKFIHLFENS